jgi:hypothetical protein
MTPIRRWTLVGLGVVLMIGVPVAVRARPVPDSPVSATALLRQVRAASGAAYSGVVETQGNLALPVAHRFTDIASLLGGRTQLRVWWRNSQDWRVDKLLPTGEVDLAHRYGVTTQWDYERQEARTTADPPIRLPRSADLLPPVLARHALQGIRADELVRLPPARVAGRDTLGLQVVPASVQASIRRVDLWADRATGIVLKVVVYGAAPTPALTAQFTEFSPAMPPRADTRFAPAAGVRWTFDTVLDIADAANQYAPFIAPGSLGGLAKSPSSRRAVGVYGTGVTQLLAVPLRGRDADPLRSQLVHTGARALPVGSLLPDAQLLRVGVLGVMLTGGNRLAWLVSGTVTDQTLQHAARDLVAGVQFQ